MASKKYFDLDIKMQNFTPPKENKITYGEVNTPYSLINEMLDLLEKDDPNVFKNPSLKWLDPASGCGYYVFALYNRLYNGLSSVIKSDIKREKHILTKMIYVCEINGDNIKILNDAFSSFKNTINLYEEDFLSTNKETYGLNEGIKFDYIIGNPPYNSNGIKKVPTLKTGNKKNDGTTIWDICKTFY